MNDVHGGDIYTYKGMTDYSSNINPFGPSAAVIEAAQQSLLDMGAYPDSRCGSLSQALSQNLGVEKSWLLFGNGAADLIFSLCFAEKPKKALLTAPSFAEYAQALTAAGCEIQYARLKEEAEFALTEDYLDELTEDLDMIFLCSPNNPTGKIIQKDLLKQILDKCRTLGIRMVMDECFYEFTDHPKQVTMQEFLAETPELVILRAFTKMYAMPGLRLGYLLCSDRQLQRRMESVRQTWSVSIPAQAAGVAALDERNRVEETRKYVKHQREWMEDHLTRIGVKYVKSSANYILLDSPYDLFERLKEKGFLIRSCENYVGLRRGYYRIAVKKKEENEKLLEAIEEVTRDGKVNYDTGNDVKCR
ncbi:MAG: histidinol-phosphate transaminase [Hespellia sp.]|nr:histidinol-phosphate transaminase [Hespellia sp.]